MKEIENIDKIIEQGLSGFNPPAPPDAWDAIAQQLANGTVPNSQTEGLGSGSNGAANTGIWQSIQGLSLAAKVVVTLLVLGLGAGIFSWVQEDTKAPGTSPIASKETSNSLRSEPMNAAGDAEFETPVTALGEKAKEANKETSVVGKLKELNSNLPNKPIGKGKEQEGSEKESNLEQGTPNVEPIMPMKDKFEKPATSPKVEHEASKDTETADVLNEKGEEEKASMPDEQLEARNEPEFGNAFSPNGDGRNDVWEIRMEKAVYYRLQVYDRKGLLVFESDQTEKYWNGTNYKTGVDCEAGVYSYVIEYQADKIDKLKIKRGIISLLR